MHSAIAKLNGKRFDGVLMLDILSTWFDRSAFCRTAVKS